MSVNKVNKTTGDLSLLAGANNITNTTGVAELSALAYLGTAANATQHDVNVAVDSKIGNIQGTHLLSSLPSDTDTAFPISLTTDVTIAGVTIPQYSRGYFCAAVDAMVVLVDANGYTYTCFRNINTWNKCVTNKPNWVSLSEVADSIFRAAFQAKWDAAGDYSLISLALLDGSEGSVFIQKKPNNNRTYGFFSCGAGNYELRHDADGWMVRKINV